MKKFSFTLDRVLSYKLQMENSLRNEHAQVIQAVTKQEEVVDGLEDCHQTYRKKFQEEKNHGCTVNSFHMYENYLSLTQKRIFTEKDRLEQLKKKEEEKREEVIQARTETSSIEKLKEKKQIEYNQVVQKSEEQLIEEFVSNASSVYARGNTA